METADENTSYILGTEERRRLELLEEYLDPITARSLDAIGIEPGWRCLEVGAGGGSVARMLCDRVGPSGRVVAVDLDTRFLEELGHENLDVHCRDVVADGLPGAGYDLVHARYLLMHLPTREKFLGELAAALRPGGWLLVEDGDAFPLGALVDGLYAEFWRSMIAAFQAAGADPHFARQLPALFDRAGLEAVEATCEVPVFRGGTLMADLFKTSVPQVRSAVLAAGATEAQLDDALRLTDDPTQWFTIFATLSVRGRAPAG